MILINGQKEIITFVRSFNKIISYFLIIDIKITNKINIGEIKELMSNNLIICKQLNKCTPKTKQHYISRTLSKIDLLLLSVNSVVNNINTTFIYIYIYYYKAPGFDSSNSNPSFNIMSSSFKSSKYPLAFNVILVAIFNLVIKQAESQCTATIPECLICANATACQYCALGYTTLINAGNMTNCHPCSSMYGAECVGCSSSEYTCLLCIANHFVYFKKCYPCTVANCVLCRTDVNICQGCGGSYGVDLSGALCTLCTVPLCSYCSPNAYSCQWCYDGYGVQGNLCVSCKVNLCLTCNGDANKCICCSNGYGALQTGSVTICQECTSYHMNKCTSCRCQDVRKCLNCTEIGKGPRHGWNDPGSLCQPCLNTQCLKCNLDYSICTMCKDTFGVRTASCVPCDNTNCLLCATDASICTKCKKGYTLSGIICIACQVPFCADCQGNVAQCYECKQYHGIYNITTCQTCDDSNCEQCSLDYTICTSCNITYGVYFPNNSCIRCTDQIYCINCSADANICVYCAPTYGPDPINHDCRRCSDKCLQCNPDFNICVECQPFYGVNLISQCQNCTDPNCIFCSFDYNICLNCTVEFGVDLTTHQCVTCQSIVANCHQCYSDSSICISCDLGFGLSGNLCATCNISCLMCSPINYVSCISCHPGKYLALAATNSCLPCMPNCIQCQNGTTCQECVVGFFVNTVQGCTQCPPYCVVCSLNVTYSLPQCSQCIAGNYQFDHHNPVTCREKCGDSITIDHPCDNDLGIPYDGCSDDCEIEPDFVCDTTDKSICSYNGTIEITVVNIDRKRLQNKCTITLKLQPPLYVFSLISQQELKNVFSFANQQITIDNIRYNSNTQELEIVADFTADFKDADIEINFTPSNGNNSRFFAGQDQTIKVTIIEQPRDWLYYKEFEFTISRMLVFLCYVLVAVGWVAAVVGFIMRRLAGLEAMFILQFSWLPILWMSPYMPMPYYDTFPLRYSCGEVIDIIKVQRTISNKPPYYEQFGLSGMMANNFIIFMIVEIVALLIVIITKCRVNMYQKQKKKFNQSFNPLSDSTRIQNKQANNHQLNQTQQEQQQNVQKLIAEFQRLENHYERAEQFLMYVCMLSLISYLNCILLCSSLKTISAMSTIVVISLQTIFLAIMLVRFFYRPDPFGFFRYSFKHQQFFSEWHFVIQLVCLLVTIGLLKIEDLPFLSGIPCLLLILLMLIRKPYKKNRDNYRAVFNWIVMCSLVGLKALIFYWPQQKQRELIVYLILFVNLLLVFTVEIFSIVFVVYDHWADKNQEEEEMKKKSATQRQQLFYKNAILKEMSKAKINKNIIANKKIPILQQVVPGKDSLLEYTKVLNSHNRHQQMLGSPLGLLEPLQITQQRLKNIREEIKLNKECKLSDGQQQLSKVQGIQPISSSDHNKQQIRETIPNQGDLPQMDKQVPKLEVKKKVVNTTLTSEKTFVHYKGAVEFVDDVKKETLHQNKDQYQKAYDQI